MNDWVELQLGNLVTYKKGFAFKSESYTDEGEVFVVRVSDTTKSSINLNSCKKISSKLASTLPEYKLETDDVIIATVGSWADNPNSIVGKVIKVPLEASGTLLNQNAVRLRCTQNIDQRYFYYNLKDPEFSGYLLGNAQGSANQASVTLKDIFSYRIFLPKLEEQKAIASILSNLDDKIDLLHRQNKTIEAMAETLFRQWFVEEGSDFREGCLADVAINVKEAIKASDLKSESKYIGLEHIDQRNIALKQYGFGSEVSSNKYVFQRYDILFGKLRPYFHKVCFAPFSGICSTDILVIRPIKSEL